MSEAKTAANLLFSREEAMTAPDWRAEEYIKGVAWRVVEFDEHGFEDIIADELSEQQAKHIAASWRMRASMEKFVKRVEAGEIRSKKTYAEFRALLASLEETE